MSFDLGVFYSLRPLTQQEAARRYVALCEREPNDLVALLDLIEPSEHMIAYCAEVLALYPPLTLVADEDDDDCPWSCDPDISDGHIVMSIRWSMYSKIAPLISRMALNRGLIVYDPQEDKVYLPSRLSNTNVM